MRAGVAAASRDRAALRAGQPPAISRLEVFLIRPTKYDDEGYLLRHFRSVLPSNTLACLYALTEVVAARRELSGISLRAHVCDESVEAVPERRIVRRSLRRRTRVIVGLVGVQTSQFPRAADLARRFRRHGLQVLIGGFHVSGTLERGAPVPPDVRELLNDGVTLVRGEVERTWGAILADAAAGMLAPIYGSTDDRPDLADAPVPRLDGRLQRKFVYRHFGTVETSRGCPFTCSFCAVISVQGRTMRARPAAGIAAAIESNYRALGTTHYFFTDDDFARNPQWRAVLENLVELREAKGIPIRFLMQVDARAHRLPGFVALAKRAGCFQVFLGLESVNAENLQAVGKRQNRVDEYAALIRTWRAAGILTHAGYIIGFAHDTPDSVRADIQTLQHDVGVDIASFFMLTPLPGAADYTRMTVAGVAMDADLNRYDTFHPVIDHPRMSRATWLALYEEAWRTFYTDAHMRRQLSTVGADQYVTLLQMYLWYLAAMDVDRFHPMMTGFFRRKPRIDRRPGSIVDGRVQHLRRRVPDLWMDVRGYACVLRTLHRLWVETCPRADPSRRSGTGWRPFLRAMFGTRAPTSP